MAACMGSRTSLNRVVRRRNVMAGPWLMSARLLKDRRAVTATEYGIIISALAFTLVTIFTQLGTPLVNIFKGVGSSL
jgi:Flp pilus assembly pilin Flp